MLSSFSLRRQYRQTCSHLSSSVGVFFLFSSPLFLLSQIRLFYFPSLTLIDSVSLQCESRSTPFTLSTGPSQSCRASTLHICERSGRALVVLANEARTSYSITSTLIDTGGRADCGGALCARYRRTMQSRGRTREKRKTWRRLGQGPEGAALPDCRRG